MNGSNAGGGENTKTPSWTGSYTSLTEEELKSHLAEYEKSTTTISWGLTIVTAVLCTYFLIGAGKSLADEQYWDAFKSLVAALIISISTSFLKSMFF